DPTLGTLATITLAGGQTSKVIPTGAAQAASNMAFNGTSLPASVTNASNQTTTYALDTLGRLLSLATPDGAMTSYALDAAGDVTVSQDPLNRVTTMAYDAFGDTTQITNPDGSTEQFQYDATFHEPTVQVDGNGNRTTMTYDATTGDLLTVKNALNQVTS